LEGRRQRRQGRHHLPPGEHGPDCQGVGGGARADGEHAQQVTQARYSECAGARRGIRRAPRLLRWTRFRCGCYHPHVAAHKWHTPLCPWGIRPMDPNTRSPGLNEKILFWASFFTLIAAGMGFSIRGEILGQWGGQFGFTQTELGEILGMGLLGFGITIIFFSFIVDLIGYGLVIVIPFLLHAIRAVATIAAPFAYEKYGKEGAYWCLYVGQFAFSLANGTCEAVINPLTATLFPNNKTHWLNILHAGWPGGLVLGALVSLGLNQVEGGVGWQIKWAIMGAPVLLYGILMVGRRFPKSEAREAAVPFSTMVLTLFSPVLLFLFLVYMMIGD